jgi:tetratricopeptide (TPR) repeat protein
MNAFGYELLRSDQVDEAIEVFKFNVEQFPNSFNVYDSLGEAFMKNGDKDLAIQNYKKSLELNPENNNAVEMLKRLEEK